MAVVTRFGGTRFVGFVPRPFWVLIFTDLPARYGDVPDAGNCVLSGLRSNPGSSLVRCRKMVDWWRVMGWSGLTRGRCLDQVALFNPVINRIHN